MKTPYLQGLAPIKIRGRTSARSLAIIDPANILLSRIPIQDPHRHKKPYFETMYSRWQPLSLFLTRSIRSSVPGPSSFRRKQVVSHDLSSSRIAQKYLHALSSSHILWRYSADRNTSPIARELSRRWEGSRNVQENRPTIIALIARRRARTSRGACVVAAVLVW